MQNTKGFIVQLLIVMALVWLVCWCFVKLAKPNAEPTKEKGWYYMNPEDEKQ